MKNNNKISDWIKVYFISYAINCLCLSISENNIIGYISIAIIILLLCIIGYILFSILNYINSK